MLDESDAAVRDTVRRLLSEAPAGRADLVERWAPVVLDVMDRFAGPDGVQSVGPADVDFEIAIRRPDRQLEEQLRSRYGEATIIVYGGPIVLAHPEVLPEQATSCDPLRGRASCVVSASTYVATDGGPVAPQCCRLLHWPRGDDLTGSDR